ncbi:O-antigen ligase family protein [Kineosporia babensis]|uniref:O-antigen ligase family protein n=1 Tax=Kineosporia babensis TaxID=499548 RepID=A0A9X1NJR2_9ACTN|nr:O-antigen ligase family protein [Kineosporia babensis]MCD5315350.1 O-antigen ligase family protein [Kineosporia babensis]
MPAQPPTSSIPDPPTRPPASSSTDLPAWPLAAAFGGYLAWWLLGLGDGVWILFAVPMLVLLIARGSVRVPPGFGIWLLFLGWVLASAVQIDSGGRMFGFAFRFSLYLAATITFVYVYNASSGLGVERVAAVMTSFWLLVVFGGFLGLLVPDGGFASPMSYLLPGGLQQNELVREMVRPTFTQGDPNGYFQMATRPSAPFKYTNGWGSNYSLLLPFVFITLSRMRKNLLFWGLAAMVPLSLIPAFSTQNRGMLLGAGIGIVYIAVRQLLRGQALALIGIGVFAATVMAMTVVIPVGAMIESRTETGDTNDTRLSLYSEAFERTLDSPVLGYGAPRPSIGPEGNPSVGTQGQFWQVMFAHGFGGLVLFVGWFLFLVVRTARPPDNTHLWLHAVLVMVSVELMYYGLMGSVLVIVMTAAAVCLRDTDNAERRQARPRAVLGPRAVAS